MRRFPQVVLVLVLFGVTAVAQDRNLWRTAADVREGSRGSIVGTVVDVFDARNEIHIEPDDGRHDRVVVAADAVTTQYNGFGTVINGKPEIFTGRSGFANVRAGDRLEVRGMGRGVGTVVAEQVTLLGRTVAAAQTGVGTTRSPNAIATPTAQLPTTAERGARIEGVIRQVNPDDGRITIETDRREIISIRTSTTTPVYYRGETYRIANLEVGDRVRVDSDTVGGNEVRARSIEVTRSVQDSGGDRRIGSLAGRVARVDRTLDIIRVDTGRSEVRVDVANVTDETGRRVRATDFRVGDRVDLSGRYGGASGDVFLATTVRFGGRVDVRPDQEEDFVAEMATVTIHGTVRETLEASPQLVLRDQAGRTIRLNVVDDFLVRTKTGGYTTAERLRQGEAVVVKAYRDAEGNYIAQTIRMR